jgi:malate/lactate dehydrogenase
MKHRVLKARPATAFGIAVAATILAAPLAHAQTDVQTNCANSGGQYTSEEVSPHFGSAPTLIETCCIAQKCTTYRDGVQGPTYGGN